MEATKLIQAQDIMSRFKPVHANSLIMFSGIVSNHFNVLMDEITAGCSPYKTIGHSVDIETSLHGCVILHWAASLV